LLVGLNRLRQYYRLSDEIEKEAPYKFKRTLPETREKIIPLPHLAMIVLKLIDRKHGLIPWMPTGMR